MESHIALHGGWTGSNLDRVQELSVTSRVNKPPGLVVVSQANGSCSSVLEPDRRLTGDEQTSAHFHQVITAISKCPICFITLHKVGDASATRGVGVRSMHACRQPDNGVAYSVIR